MHTFRNIFPGPAPRSGDEPDEPDDIDDDADPIDDDADDCDCEDE